MFVLGLNGNFWRLLSLRIMARFFFHLSSDRGLIEDDNGLDLPDLAAARQAAFEAARGLAAQAVRRGEDGPWNAIVVTDAAGKPVLELPLEEALPPRFQCD
jgi:hypothetical protein